MPFFKSTIWSRLGAALLVPALTALPGCATVPQVSYHAFEFDGWFDKWATKIDLLAYSYGDPVNDRFGLVHEKVAQDKQTLSYRTGVNGTMPIGEFLYVKWRVKATGEVVEDKVDLRSRLPADMFQHSITFVIDNKQLYVYLVTPKPAIKGVPELKTYLSDSRLTYEIYPASTYKP
jgi:hypothetical protein